MSRFAPARAALVVAPLLLLAAAAPAAAPLDDVRRTAVVDVVERVAPSVVSIFADEVVKTRIRTDDFWRDFTEPRYRQELATTALGSGVIIGPHHVVTNHHVVSRAARIRIALADRREFVCEVVGTDPELDLAVLRVKTDLDLPAAELANSSDIRVGETVIAIGNPFGLGHTVTTGVISALHRTLNADGRTFHDFLQTDASINPGNSGGALLNLRGHLVGINTAIYGRAQGIGFAIPANRVRRIATDIIEHGAVRQGYLGFDLRRVNRRTAKEKGLSRPEGVHVVHVTEGGPAFTAGLREGDIILAVEGFPILTAGDYATKMRDYTPGSSLQLEVWRGSARVPVEIVATEIPNGFAERVLERQLGITVGPLGENTARRFDIDAGTPVRVREVRIGSKAAKEGLEPGDVITHVEDIRVKNAELLLRAVLRARRSGGLKLRLARGAGVRVATFEL